MWVCSSFPRPFIFYGVLKRHMLRSQFFSKCRAAIVCLLKLLVKLTCEELPSHSTYLWKLQMGSKSDQDRETTRSVVTVPRLLLRPSVHSETPCRDFWLVSPQQTHGCLILCTHAQVLTKTIIECSCWMKTGLLWTKVISYWRLMYVSNTKELHFMPLLN